jgi:hypothetical protein
MPVLRVVRIAVIALVVPVLFTLSQAAARIRGNESLPGLLPAIGALTAVFFLRALASEWSAGPEMNRQKDLLWGVACGGVITVVSQLLWGG